MVQYVYVSEARRQSVVSNGVTTSGETTSSALEGKADSEETQGEKDEERAAEISAIRVAPGQVKKDGNEYKVGGTDQNHFSSL